LHSSIPGARDPISVAISFDLLRKRRLMREDVSKIEVDRRLKRRLTLVVIFKDDSCQRECHDKANGKKKVMEKERRSKDERLWRMWRLLAMFKPRHLPLPKSMINFPAKSEYA
jgi:hypothetical protein